MVAMTLKRFPFGNLILGKNLLVPATPKCRKCEQIQPSEYRIEEVERYDRTFLIELVRYFHNKVKKGGRSQEMTNSSEEIRTDDFSEFHRCEIDQLGGINKETSKARSWSLYKMHLIRTT
jgi:hypothetical protein